MRLRHFAGRSWLLRRTDIQVDPRVPIVLAMLLLLVPVPWMLAMTAGSVVHELSHLGAVRLMGGKLTSLHIGLEGLSMDTTPLPAGKSIVCSLAGPVGALGLLFFARWLPRLAVCVLFQSAYHLLPLYPLDGGRALRSFLELVRIRDTDCVCSAVGTVTLLLLGLAGLRLWFVLKMGMLPLLLTGILIFRVCREKNLAKKGRTGYNRCTK